VSIHRAVAVSLVLVWPMPVWPMPL